MTRKNAIKIFSKENDALSHEITIKEILDIKFEKIQGIFNECTDKNNTLEEKIDVICDKTLENFNDFLTAISCPYYLEGVYLTEKSQNIIKINIINKKTDEFEFDYEF